MATTASTKYLIRGYYPTIGFKFWYVSNPNSPFDEYPSSDPSYPSLLPTNLYQDVVILDAPQGGGSEGGDEYIVFSTSVQVPSSGDVVYVRNNGSSTGEACQAIATATVPARCYAIGIATSSANYVRTSGQISVNSTGAILAGQDVFLSTTAGKITATPPTSISTAVVFIGTAIEDAASGTCTVDLNIDRPEFIV